MIEPVLNRAESYETAQSNSAQEIKDQFLTMLIAQIQYQDPLNPMEAGEFTSQLAQLSSVEELQKVNKNLGYLQLYMASINNSQALGFIGKEIMASGNSVYWDGETAPDINYILNNDASNVVVNIFNAAGRFVASIQAGAQDEGRQDIPWNGVDIKGESLPPGVYNFKITASDTIGNPVDAITMRSGSVDGITFEGGITYVTVQGQNIPIGDIIEIKSSTPPAVQETKDDSLVEEIVDAVTGLGESALKAAPWLL